MDRSGGPPFSGRQGDHARQLVGAIPQTATRRLRRTRENFPNRGFWSVQNSTSGSASFGRSSLSGLVGLKGLPAAQVEKARVLRNLERKVRRVWIDDDSPQASPVVTFSFNDVACFCWSSIIRSRIRRTLNCARLILCNSVASASRPNGSSGVRSPQAFRSQSSK